MNEIGITIILLCFLAAAVIVLWNRRKARKTMDTIEKMLDAAMDGSFSESTFDESKLSALETKFAHYLSAAETSSRNVAQEKDRIKSLIADISHQTKTPIANLLLYSELLMEEDLPASAKANAHWNLSNAAIFWWPTMWWKFKKAVAVFWSAPALPC